MDTAAVLAKLRTYEPELKAAGIVRLSQLACSLLRRKVASAIFDASVNDHPYPLTAVMTAAICPG